MRTSLYWCAALALCLTGCTAVGPDYERPQTPEQDVVLPNLVEGHDISPEETAEWWSVFNDPVLTELIERVLRDNRVLRASIARVREARARLGISKAGLLPEVDVGGVYRRFRNSDNAGIPGHGNFYHAGFDAVWELDIFGRRRREIEAARAQFEAEAASLEDVWVSLAAETAISYVRLHATRQLLAVANRNLKIQKESLELADSRAKAGLSDNLAVEQARYSLEQTRATIPAFLEDEEAALNALAVLSGTLPGSLRDTLALPAAMPSVAPRTLAGIPANLLRRRPDLRAAERQLAAQTARIGVAKADLYPTFRLTGSIGLEATDASNFFEADSRYFGISPQVVWPIFRAGSIRANIEVQDALQEQALASYEQSVLEAVRELRDAMTAYGREYARCEALRKAVASAGEAVELARDRYKTGLSDFNSVLDAQRSLLRFEESVVLSESRITTTLVRIYKALGGGWRTMDN